MSMAMARLMPMIGQQQMLNKDGNVDTDDLLLVFEKFDRPVNLAAPLLSAESAGPGLEAA